MLAIGSVLDRRYRLIRLLGAGGFAQVFLAEDVRLHRRVAVKVLDVDRYADPTEDFHGRFTGEARLLALLKHPNILEIHDYGEAERTAYIVSPFVEGGSLAGQIAGSKRLPQQIVAEYLRQVASALDYAYERHAIVHRDVKPQNLLVTKENQLLVADFGIAKALGAMATHTAIGTFAYMAPEQFQGSLHRATDIYALGCVLFQLLTGEVPFPGPLEQAMHGHLQGAIPSVVARSGGQVPRTVEPVIRQALEKKPGERFPTASGLATAFMAAIASVSTVPVRQKLGGATTPNSLPQDRKAPPPSATPQGRKGLTLRGHSTAITGLAWNRASGILASSAEDATVRIWQADGTCQEVLREHTGPVNAIAWSPSGQYLASASSDRTVCLWLPKGARPTVLTGHTHPVWAVAWSPDGTMLASASGDGRIWLWNSAGTLHTILAAHSGIVRALAYSPDGEVLASAPADRTIRLRPTSRGRLTALSGHLEEIRALSWSPSGHVLASASLDRTVRLWQRGSTDSRILKGHTAAVHAIAWSPDGRLLASASSDRTVRLWEADGLLHDTFACELPPQALAWSPDGLRLAIGMGNVVEFWA